MIEQYKHKFKKNIKKRGGTGSQISTLVLLEGKPKK